MLHRLILTLLVAALTCLVAPVVVADTTPDPPAQEKGPLETPPEELRKKIIEKIIEKIKQNEEIPEELKAKLVEEVKKEAEAKPEKSDEDGEDKEKKADDKKEKRAEPSMNERVSKLRTQMQEMETEFEFKVAKYKKELEERRLNIEKLKVDRVIEDALREEETRKQKVKIDEMKYRQQLIDIEGKLSTAKHAASLRESNARKATIEAQLANHATQQKLDDVVLKTKQYTDKPFSEGVLTISDRRIELNGPIMTGAAKHVADRIHYYNNQSNKPIFLVIDSSPGGSGMEGLHILQAMGNSRAPVHVVVKRFAASMAAIITTLADESYAYPNAIILHHQGSSMVAGNTTQQREQLERFKEMSARLVGEVAEKLGLSEEQFVKRMYENRSTGDWDLFADNAVKQRWVGHVVNEVRETAIRKRPEKRSPPVMFRMFSAPNGQLAAEPAMERYEMKLEEQIDEQGRRFVELPRLNALDHLFLYNPDKYYR